MAAVAVKVECLQAPGVYLTKETHFGHSYVLHQPHDDPSLDKEVVGLHDMASEKLFEK